MASFSVVAKLTALKQKAGFPAAFQWVNAALVGSPPK
ncbi:hypothetical protein ACVMAJ_006915 [Bradyrhizobium sp. USDA 4448]